MTTTKGAAGRMVAAGDTGLHLYETGSGTGDPIVWLHGGGPGASGRSNFERNFPAFTGYRNLVFDLPQYGASEKPLIPERRFTFNAKAVAAALDELGVARAHFVGNSLGGATAMRLAIDYPEKVDRLVLMGPAGIVVGPDLPEGIHLLLDYMMGEPDRDKMARLLRAFVYDQSLVTDELIEARYQASLDPDAIAAQQQSGPGLEDIESHLGEVRAKTLIIWGREDKFVSLESALAFTRGIEDARLVVLPRCGHWAQVEQQERFDRLVLDFLRGEWD